MRIAYCLVGIVRNYADKFLHSTILSLFSNEIKRIKNESSV